MAVVVAIVGMVVDVVMVMVVVFMTIKCQRTADCDAEENENKKTARRIGRKCMDRDENAGSNEESAEQAQGKGRYCEEQCPALEQAAFLSHRK